MVQNLGRHEKWTAYDSLGVREAGCHPEIDNFGLFSLAYIQNVLQLEVPMINSHFVQRINSLQKVNPDFTRLVLTKLVFVLKHVLI